MPRPQVRHGCILGWKYILATRQDLAAELLPQALPSLTQGLQDKCAPHRRTCRGRNARSACMWPIFHRPGCCWVDGPGSRTQISAPGCCRDDDVRAAAAEALVPVADALLAAGQGVVGEVRDILWDILLDLQELSTSTASVMHLLAKLYSDPACQGNRCAAGATQAQLHSACPRSKP